MSIYSALSITMPVINYSAVHQMKKGVEEKEYVKTTQEMHRMVRSESDKVVQAWKTNLAEITASSVQSTRGTLSQFLTLPLETDMKEIYRILEDQIGNLLGQTLPIGKIGVIASTEGRFLSDREQNSTLQAMLTRGTEYLKKMKFKMTDPTSHIFESDFVVEGGLNLDIIEHIVRDRMGIYATAHGHHTEQSDSFVFAAHNEVFLQGNHERGDTKFEAAIHFSKGKPQYAPFRKELIEMLEAVQTDLKLPHCSVWQRKLGLGAGTEFNIRLRATDRKSLREFVLALAKLNGKKLVHGPVVENGSLLVKEFVM